MRAFVSIFLFLLFLSQAFSPFVLDSVYRLNRSYITQTLCENKTRPQLHCNGKCYLSKQIEKEGKDAALPSGNKKERADEVYYFPEELPVVAKVPADTNRSFPHFLPVSLSSYHHPLLRPPQVSFV